MHGLKQLVYDDQPFFPSNQSEKTNQELYILWKQNKSDNIFLILYTQLWMKLEEIYRFPNGMEEVDGSLCWNVDALLYLSSSKKIRTQLDKNCVLILQLCNFFVLICFASDILLVISDISL